MRHSRRDRQNFVLVTGPPKIRACVVEERTSNNRTDRRHYRNQEGASDEDVSKAIGKGRKPILQGSGSAETGSRDGLIVLADSARHVSPWQIIAFFH